MASTSVERRATTPSGGIKMSCLGGRLPAIKRSSSAAASYPSRQLFRTTLVKRDLAELARDLVVVDADQGDVLGYAHPEVQTGVENRAAR